MTDDLITYHDIAERYGRSARQIATWAKHDAFPDAVEKHGKTLLFPAAAVERFVDEHIRPPAPRLGEDPEELLDVTELAAATGWTGQRIWSAVAHGTFPHPVGKRRKRNRAGEPTERWESLWRSDEVAAALKGKTSRR